MNCNASLIKLVVDYAINCSHAYCLLSQFLIVSQFVEFQFFVVILIIICARVSSRLSDFFRGERERGR